MKKQFLIRLFALMLVFCMVFLNSCSLFTNTNDKNNQTIDKIENNDDANEDHGGGLPDGAYVEGVVLVKYTGEDENVFAGLDIKSVEALYEGAKWYSLELNDPTKTVEMVQELAELEIFDYVDYDYIMATDGPKEDAEQNPGYDNQVNLGLSNIPNGWTRNGKAPGGSADVVVAVIDTGVDYNHLDLRNNIWTNPAEIPDNGIDDDKNGYVDDVYGWDFVGNDKDPMDDNGHGTHVAGIIAAENNKIGGIGVAYNSKVMVLKAGNSSGYFNNSDIAEAIQYAYMNGASVINMSFGGSNISIAVEEALEEAYNTTILVAAAGNDGACNNLACKACEKVGVSYPAALPYVIGVMSTDKDGKHISSFSNYDHYPYDSIEYEVYAVGEGVGSTWPSNKYACLNGTSMAAPTVAGIAALLRSYYTDREVYSTKFIQSQIVNTGTVNPHILDHVTDEAHSVADVLEAMTKLPTPAVNLYDYRIDDSISISANNNGNGVVDAGETVRLYISLHNRGGVATDVNVTIDTYRREIGDETMTDPYFTLVNTSMSLSDIGTYSVRNSSEYFEIVVAENCPNDYLADFNIRFTYKNGMNDKDNTNYSGDGVAQFNVSNGYHLAGAISEDTVFTSDKLYIIGEDVIIPEGVTVTFEEGCEIQFYDDREYYNSPMIMVYGTLNIAGTKDNMVTIAPNERNAGFACLIQNSGHLSINYVSATNLFVGDRLKTATSQVVNSYLFDEIAAGDNSVSIYKNGQTDGVPPIWNENVDLYSNCYIELTSWSESLDGVNFDGNYILIASLHTNKFECKELINNFIQVKEFDNLSDFANTAPVVSGEVSNNFFNTSENNVKKIVGFEFRDKTNCFDNAFSSMYQQYASQLIKDYYDASGNPTVDVYGSLADASLLWPYVESVEMFDKNGNLITTVGKEEIKVRVTFNRPMDKDAGTFLTFGTIEPYADYRIDGEYVSDTVWEGTYTLKAQIENGQNFLKVNNAWAAEDQTKTVFGEYQLHEFTIDTTAAMAMNLIANPKPEGIELTWAQDDYDTLMGYNIYRSESKDGNYVKINPSILLDTDSTFLDTNAEPGKTYWYTFTVVLSDFSESNPAGKVQATAVDTIFPNIYHTPVNQGYLNNNLVISCTASDNISIDTLTLYYRTVGATEWRTLTMSKVNDKFSATVFGSDLTLEGLEYYIVATDGRNVISKGDAEDPYQVVIKDASEISRLGDVDGDGVITTKDALMITDAINGDLIMTDDEFRRADLNSDGVLASSEALRILQYINGKVNTLN